jgi:hypothetical protein
MTVKITKGYQIEDLENLLQATLKPVTPSPGFVQQLRKRLTEPGIPTIRYPDPKMSHYLLLATATLLSSTFLILTGSRLVIAVLGALGLLHYSRQQNAREQLTPSKRLA